MRVGLFAHVLDKESAGPKVYIEGLGKSLLQVSKKKDIEIVFLHSDSDSDHPLFKKGEEIVLPESTVRRELALRRSDLDLLHYHGYKTLTPLFANLHNIPKVATIHGVPEFFIPECFSTQRVASRRFLWPQLTQLFDKVITVTNASRRQLIQGLKLSPDKIKSIHNGVRTLTHKDMSIDFPKQYLLNVNSVNSEKEQHRKNIDTLFDGYCKYRKLGGDFPLVLVGSGWKSQNILKKQNQYGIQENCLILGRVPEEQLHALYQQATIYVYPSRYEGFGLSILEAMSVGCPVVISDQPNVTEVAGNAAEVYGTPEDSIALAQTLYTLTQKPEQRKELQEQGYENVKRFSWQKCAQETISVYESVKE